SADSSDATDSADSSDATDSADSSDATDGADSSDATDGTDGTTDATDGTDGAVCAKANADYLAAAGALNTCTTGADCEWVTHPVCGQGCAVAVNATADQSALEAAWQAFSSGGCVPDPIVPACCDLAPPQWGFGCDQGKCTPCSYQCALDCTCKKDAVGCDLPVCEDEGCPALVAAVEAEVGKSQNCQKTADCMRFEHPICGTIGCYQRAVARAADLTTLSALAQAAQDALCEPFHCGCGPVGEGVCQAGKCVLCPGPDCQTDCDALLGQLQAVVAENAACTNNALCVKVDTNLCAVPGLGCYAVGIAQGDGIQALTGLLEQYSKLGCPTSDCDCAPPTDATCTAGKCTASGQ
ncbi:MAG: hypothetical protein IV100_00195, partial [Myxococcales bacterium]|nr:hypothetical protein [Myxococcales bacterium]